MADAGLFIGWGAPVRGREKVGLDVFNEAVAWWGEQQQAGRIESFEVAFLQPHGGDLAGFILIRGSEAQIDELRRDDAFDRLNTRASLIVEGFGIVDVALGEGLGRALEHYRAAADEFG